ncbi:hypothetical protein [Tumebacillus permanentifrigoris]|uniref:Uncharacterized protein n=1 Tax=Tumebacillus permanentifrigoris TaxID=378543 RepID=A0A316DCF9_9BACL|nr:hypothetical protein [Tumebacillus permanentifrigoris]PWK12995.1 hypothetical protein C7459_10813 [Tumebacillus permanentifrigoris]
MGDRGWWLLGFLLLSCAVSAVLVLLAATGRDLRKYGGRQRFYEDLYRFTVMILTGLAMYLLGSTPGVWQAVPLPESVVLFAMTALPTWVLCAVSKRWYLGWCAAAVMQGFVVQALIQMGGVHGDVSALWWPQVVCDLGGVVLYAMQSGKQQVKVHG